MRNSRVKMFGRLIPVWLLAVALIAATAGAATGIVLAGTNTGTIATTVDQAVILDSIISVGGTSDASYKKVSDDGTSFLVANELNQGDEYTVSLRLNNRSGATAEMVLKLDVPRGITVKVAGADDVSNLTRTGLGSWVFSVDNSPNAADDLTITVSVADDAAPGFYQMRGEVKQISP